MGLRTVRTDRQIMKVFLHFIILTCFATSVLCEESAKPPKRVTPDFRIKVDQRRARNVPRTAVVRFSGTSKIAAELRSIDDLEAFARKLKPG
jgi:hypothetical protein